MPSEASVEFIAMLWPLVSVASCDTPLDACRYNAADAPYVEARTMPVATNSALNEAFMSATPPRFDSVQQPQSVFAHRLNQACSVCRSTSLGKDFRSSIARLVPRPRRRVRIRSQSALFSSNQNQIKELRSGAPGDQQEACCGRPNCAQTR